MVDDSSSIAGILLFALMESKYLLLSPFYSNCCHVVSYSAVLDTAAGVWCDTKSVVMSPRMGRSTTDMAAVDSSNELSRRCRHAAAAVGDLIFMHGGLSGGKM